ncbi:MAG: tRNA (adenosine(37)-N6)-dimethylallyltransferase MiaA [Candidatus Edwardsbacteria bacterium]|nr:tRNA (adenosine(37)-N6)-dimethylallyltransferase MiaA [Candidatus Edwardsbacteria bacterium]
MTGPVTVIAGPTAAGKTAAGIALAQRLGAEIVSADSRQVYKYLDIGTAKPTTAERASVPHHLVDFLDPDRPYSAADYAADAREAMDALDAQGKPYIVGGSGLYLRALIEGLAAIPPADAALRQEFSEFAGSHGKAALHQRLAEVDPATAARLAPNDTVRITRALEVHRLTGKPISQWHSNERVKDHRTYRLVVLDAGRDELYARIERRIDAMIQQGLVDEVRGILDQGYAPSLNALRTVGYRETIAHLNGEYELDRAIELVKQNTRNFAKRQLTWFRGMKQAEWMTPERLLR